MSAPYSPLWMRRGSYAHRDLRVSDAERAEVADRLSKHYSDGRLDQAEFDERVDQAMRAKTQSDLSGLFDDLPSPEESEPAQTSKTYRVAPRRRDERPHRHHHILFLALMVVVAFALAHALVQLYVPWLLIGVFAVLWLVYGPWHHHHRS
jgi:Flp pilus assembly protein TadB